MRRVFAIIINLLFIFVNGQAQTDVYFKLNHKLGDTTFAYNQTTTTNGINSADYKLNRLEYYIAEITLTHDGGQKTVVQDKWILVDASIATFELLGNYNITTLESISFGVGVEASVNHTDPSARTAGHPLANKFPSMHWGWTAGYRFVAMEGVTGLLLDQAFQIHALGDANYHTQTHNMAGYMYNGDLIIQLDADYNAALDFITVDANLRNHGESGEAASLLTNFSNNVFSEAAVGLSEDKSANIKFEISPNPSDGEFFVDISNSLNNLSYSLRDLTGREVQAGTVDVIRNRSFMVEQKGVFILNLYHKNIFIGSKKVVTQ